MIREKIQISEEETLICERNYYEWTGLKILIDQFTGDSKFKPDENHYRILLKEYAESYSKYNSFWGILCNKYLTQEEQKYSYELNFQSKTLSRQVAENK